MNSCQHVQWELGQGWRSTTRLRLHPWIGYLDVIIMFISRVTHRIQLVNHFSHASINIVLKLFKCMLVFQFHCNGTCWFRCFALIDRTSHGVVEAKAIFSLYNLLFYMLLLLTFESANITRKNLRSSYSWLVCGDSVEQNWYGFSSRDLKITGLDFREVKTIY